MHTIAEFITHLTRIRNQDAPIMIRTHSSRLGQTDLNPIGYIQRVDGAYAIELEDPWGHEPEPLDQNFTARPQDHNPPATTKGTPT